MEPMHRLFLKQVDDWTESDLEALVAAKLAEGMRIDYKRDLKLDTKSQRAEAAKDVSGLANAQGGWLFFGIDEDDSKEPLPTSVDALPAEGLQTRLEDILDTTLEPKVDFHATSVPVDGGVVIVMRVEPRSGNPIMVQGYGEYRYFRRSGTRTRPMSGTEVAEAFATAGGRDEALYGVLASLPLKARIARSRSLDEAGLTIQGHGKPTWRPLPTVVVAAIDCPRPLIGPPSFSVDAFAESSEGMRGTSPRKVRPDGRWVLGAFGVEQEETVDAEGRPPPNWIYHRVAVYREGVIEWARRYRDAEFTIPAKSLAEDVHNSLRYAAGVLSDVGYFGRLATYIRIENAERAVLDFPREWDLATHPPGVEWMGHFREVSVNDLLLDPTPTVREAMDVIWQGFGVQRCPYFDHETGAWKD